MRAAALAFLMLLGLTVAAPPALASQTIPLGPGSALGELAGAAEADYQAGRYGEAVKKYEQLAERAPHDPALLYNLATAHERAGQRGLAIWRYLQAQELSPRDPDIRHNLTLLAPEIAKQTAIAPIPPVNWLYHQFSANEWAGAAGVTGVLAMLLLALVWRQEARPWVSRVLRRLALALAVAAAIGWPFAIARYYHEDVLHQAVVTEDKTVSRTGPGANHVETYPLPVGTVVRVEDEPTRGWVKFSYAGGRVGYVERSRVRFI